MENILKQLLEGQQQLFESQRQLFDGQKQLFSEIKSIRNEMATKQDLARMENDHGTKLSALLDGYKQNAVILDRHTEQLDRIEDKVTHHDIKISILDKTKSNRRIAKIK